jgi:SAM-dependent methyltransferase
MLRVLTRTVGRLSTGIDMSYRYGFTSGTLLDYVYRNEPSGRFGVGTLIDRAFLSHAGWEAVRERRRLLLELLERAVKNALVSQDDVLIVDVASGPARYVLDTLARFENDKVVAVCRDLDERWLDEGRAKASARGLGGVTLERGDALERASFASLPRAPQVMVSSGFYDWMPDDEMVKTSIDVIAEVIAPAGFFVFTNQTGHVDLDMTNEVFVGFGGQKLQMRTRSTVEVNGWVQDAGFDIVDTRSNESECYAVTLAQKRPA